MTQAFSLTADKMTPAKGMYAYMPNRPQVHNAILAGEAVATGAFVKLDATSTNGISPVVTACEPTEVPYGMVVYDARKPGAVPGDKVALASTGDSVFLVAAGAITVGAKLQFTADGKVDDTTTSGSAYIGIAETKAGADGDFVQVRLDFGLGLAE